jgi:thiol-disulfide isomerase/thioredoxin
VPSCLVVGRKVENFALYGLDGEPWELRRRRQRLVLVDFWYTNCGPCLAAIGHLRELQEMYGSYGLQVVGIAYEKGPAAEQVRKVNAVRERYKINYTTLLGGGGAGPCPVKAQFGITAFPTLVLIDEAGQVVWRSEGLDETKLRQLQYVVYQHLSQPLR